MRVKDSTEEPFGPGKGYCFVDPKFLNEIGTIQGAGYSVAVKYVQPDNLEIVCVSENFARAPWLSSSAVLISELLDRSVVDVFGLEKGTTLVNQVSRVRELGGNGTSPNSNSLRNFSLLTMTDLSSGHASNLKSDMSNNSNISDISSSGSSNSSKNKILLCCSVVTTANSEVFLLELEELSEVSMEFSFPKTEIIAAGEFIPLLRAAKTIEGVTGAFVDSCMKMMEDGFDRGMVYKFEPDGSGNVIYERIRDPDTLKSSYLAMRFPAQDIPPQARALFVKAGLRFIADVNSAPVPLRSANWTEPLDQSMGRLRQVSPCHLNYLRGMGVRATMSIPIIVEDRLWGLYVFHSYTGPFKPPVERRIVLEMAASISWMRVESFEREAFAMRKYSLTSLMVRRLQCAEIHEFLRSAHKEILSILEAHSIILVRDGGYESRQVFGNPDIALTEWGFQDLSRRCTMSSSIALASYKEGLSGDGAGVIFYKHPNFMLALIRRSEINDVRWGRKPDPPNEYYDPTDKSFMTPTLSFELFVEKAKISSRDWTEGDKELGLYFYEQMVQHVHAEILASFVITVEESNAQCARALDATKEHNEFFAHMSHELRTPFHGVMSTLQILHHAEADPVKNPLPPMERREMLDSALECGENMLNTLNDILTIAKNRHATDVRLGDVSLTHLVQSTRRMMTPIGEIKGVDFRVQLETIDAPGQVWPTLVVSSDQTKLLQVANNLSNNAIKFTEPGGSVTLRAYLLTTAHLQELWASRRAQYADYYECIAQKQAGEEREEKGEEGEDATIVDDARKGIEMDMALLNICATTSALSTDSYMDNGVEEQEGRETQGKKEKGCNVVVRDQQKLGCSGDLSGAIDLCNGNKAVLLNDSLETIIPAIPTVTYSLEASTSSVSVLGSFKNNPKKRSSPISAVSSSASSSPSLSASKSFVRSQVLHYVFEVEDTGKGVTSEEMKVMFDAYKQVSQGVTKSYQGTGLGLHICRIHTENLHGSLSIASTPGQGTLFLCSYPVRVAVEEECASAAAVSKGASASIALRPTQHTDITRNNNSGSSSSSSGQDRAMTVHKDGDDRTVETTVTARESSSAALQQPRTDFNAIKNEEKEKVGPSHSPFPLPLPIPASSTPTAVAAAKGLSDDARVPSVLQNTKSTDIPVENHAPGHGKIPLFYVVDDSTVNLRLSKRKILMTLGESADVRLALDGQLAVEAMEGLIQEGKYHTLCGIFMDYHMPRCSGVEAIQRIRVLEAQHDLRPAYIVGFTADATEVSSSKLLEAGADRVIAKPTPAGLMEQICVQLASTAAASAVPSQDREGGGEMSQSSPPT